MAFLTVNNSVLSFAEYSDVVNTDQRVFESNEIDWENAPGSPANLAEYIEDLCIKATNRIIEKIRVSDKWHSVCHIIRLTLNMWHCLIPTRILRRQSDFTDMCSYYVLKEYLLGQRWQTGATQNHQKFRRSNTLKTSLTTCLQSY